MTNDATTALLRALRGTFGNLRVDFEEISSRGWASVTFAGARHEVTFRLDGEGGHAAADAFTANLDTAEFDLRDHILADIVLVSREDLAGPDDAPRVRLKIEALTVEDGRP